MQGKITSEPASYPLLKKLMHSPIVWAVLSIFSLLGIVLTFVNIFPPPRKQLTYAVDSRVVIASDESMMDGLDISYLGNKITELRSTNIKIWNSGSEAIRRNDIASLGPLSVNLNEGGKIYKVSIIETSNEAAQFSGQWTLGDFKAIVDFEYANPTDYVVLQVLHSADLYIDVTAMIIGGERSSVINSSLQKEYNLLSRISWIFNLIFSAFMLVTYIRDAKRKKQFMPKAFFIFFVVVFLLSVFLVLNMIFS